MGKALTEALLQHPDTTVVGVSRRATIEHARYRYQPLDLADVAAVRGTLGHGAAVSAAARLTLINKSCYAGRVRSLGDSQHFAVMSEQVQQGYQRYLAEGGGKPPALAYSRWMSGGLG